MQSKNIDANSFWQNHYSKYKASGLSRKAYCRQNTISYDGFTYWLKKYSCKRARITSIEQEEKTQFLPIQLKPDRQNPDDYPIFTLQFKNGCFLQIQSEQALSIILEKLA